MKPLTAWSPGFSRFKNFKPPEGGTPNQPRFMESRHDFHAVHGDHKPQTSWTVPPTRCCRRLVGRGSFGFLCRQDAGSTLGFMERNDFLSGTLAHEQGLPDWSDTPKLANADLCTAPFRYLIRRHEHQRNKPSMMPWRLDNHPVAMRRPLLRLPSLNPQLRTLNLLPFPITNCFTPSPPALTARCGLRAMSSGRCAP